MWKLTKWLRIITAEDSFFLIYWNRFDVDQNLFFIYHFFLFWRQSRKKAVPLLSVMCGHIKVQYACKHIRYCVLFWCKLLSSLAWTDFEAKHFSGIENLTSVYMCIGYVCGCGCVWDRRRWEANVEWRRGVYGYSTTMSAADLQTGDEIVRRLWWVQQVFFTYLTLPYPIGSAINMKLVGDCRDTSSLSVRRPCRKVVNWVYHTSISFVATRISCQRKKKLRHLPPYTTPTSATPTTPWRIGIHHSTVTLETGKLDTTFSHKTARLSRLSFRRARH